MPMTRKGAIFCDLCGAGWTEVDDEYLAKAWGRQVGTCTSCSAELNYWDRLVAQVSDRSDLWHAVTMAGGLTTTFLKSVPSGGAFWLEFSAYGIPEDAVIYKVLHTVQSGARPQGMTVLAHASQTLGGKLHPDAIALHPVVLGPAGTWEDTKSAEVSVAFVIVWTHRASHSLAQDLLLSAFGAYGEGDLKRCILDADSAVEVCLKQLVTAKLAPGWDRKLPNLGYEQRLFVVSVILSAHGLGTIPSGFLQLLVDLRSERNKVAHGTNEQVDAGEAARLISGALVAISQLPILLAKRESLPSPDLIDREVAGPRGAA